MRPPVGAAQPLLWLFDGEPGSTGWQKELERGVRRRQGLRKVVEKALTMLPPEVVDRPAP